jgi:hypothetical protein
MRKQFRCFGTLFSALLALALGCGLGSCGIETYKRLDPISSGIPMLLNTTAYIYLPGGQPPYFRNFTIYYRIYISDLPVAGVVDTGLMAQINPALYSDYNFFLPYTNTVSTVSPTTMGATFANRKYFPLELENASIDRILSTGGRTITLDFAANAQYNPSLIEGDIRNPPSSTPYPQHQLSRHTSNASRPYANNFYFVNSDDVNNGDHISSDSSNTNQDVQNSSAQSISGDRHTYVSMYILSYGLDDSNFTNIYSIPTFIGIFRLPDDN